MKNILILSYYFPPCNGAPADRPNSWFKYFNENNIYPIILTRQWNGKENSWGDYLKDSEEKETKLIETKNGKIIYLPYQSSLSTKIWIKFLSKVPLLSTFITFTAALLNKTNLEFSFKRFYLKGAEVTKDHKIDAILVTLPPFSLINTGIKLANKLDIPLVVDYRDLWDNDLLNPHFKVSIKKRILNKIVEFYVKKQTSNVSLVSLVTPSFTDYFRSNLAIKTKLVTQLNGFDEELFEKNLSYKAIQTDEFIIALFGAFYPEKQDMSILFKGISKFMNQYGDTKKIKVVFYGIKGQPDAVKLIEKHFETQMEKVEICNRIPRAEAIRKMQTSTILIYSGWQNYKGIYSTKIFDYLASGRKILIAPGDNDVIDSIILESKQGIVANNDKEVSNHLDIFYLEWLKKGFVSNSYNENFVSQYSRRSQSDTFAKEINKIINHKK